MRILLDEQLPRQLARQLRGHLVRAVQQQGWAGRQNGELLQLAAAASFEIFLTADQNLQFQQSLAGSPLAVIVLIAPTNKIEDLAPLVPALLKVIPEVRRGEVHRLGPS